MQLKYVGLSALTSAIPRRARALLHVSRRAGLDLKTYSMCVRAGQLVTFGVGLSPPAPRHKFYQRGERVRGPAVTIHGRNPG